MNRRGAALLIVLWLITLVTGLVAVSLGGARLGAMAGRNRLRLLRAGWAREACLEIMLARSQGAGPDQLTPEALALDSIDLGDGIWCEVAITDPGTQINLNSASPEALEVLIGDSALVDLIVRGRPWAASEAVRGLDPRPDSSAWVSLVTTRGTGKINLAAAPDPVLATVPGLGRDGARSIVGRRGLRLGSTSSDQITAALPVAVRERVLSRQQDFLAATTVTAEQLVASIGGHARDGPVARMTVTLVPAAGRLAVVRREVE